MHYDIVIHFGNWMNKTDPDLAGVNFTKQKFGKISS